MNDDRETCYKVVVTRIATMPGNVKDVRDLFATDLPNAPSTQEVEEFITKIVDLVWPRAHEGTG